MWVRLVFLINILVFCSSFHRFFLDAVRSMTVLVSFTPDLIFIFWDRNDETSEFRNGSVNSVQASVKSFTHLVQVVKWNMFEQNVKSSLTKLLLMRSWIRANYLLQIATRCLRTKTCFRADKKSPTTECPHWWPKQTEMSRLMGEEDHKYHRKGVINQKLFHKDWRACLFCGLPGPRVRAGIKARFCRTIVWFKNSSTIVRDQICLILSNRGAKNDWIRGKHLTNLWANSSINHSTAMLVGFDSKLPWQGFYPNITFPELLFCKVSRGFSFREKSRPGNVPSSAVLWCFYSCRSWEKSQTLG